MRSASVCAAAVAVLAACGGGDNGLMPDAPKLGAVLHEDAAALRPLQPGSTRSYEAQSSTRPAQWRVDVNQRASEEGVQETARRSDGSVTSISLAYRHGDVVQFDACELFGAMTGCQEWIELRSPVQVGDQIELVNRDDISQDITGDGRPDRFEHVVYRRVIGEELVSLPVLGSVRAVRVDTVMRQRVTVTDGEGPPWRFEATSSTWYAPGLGIVQRHIDVARSMFGPHRTEDHHLVAWGGPAAQAPASPPTP